MNRFCLNKVKSKFSLVLAFMVVITLISCGENSQKKEEVANESSEVLSKDLIRSIVDQSVVQYKQLNSNVPSDKLPKTYFADKDSLALSNTRWWTSGFYPGTLWYLYELSGDSKIYEIAKQKLEILEVEKTNKGTHDLGFMLYCSFGNANRLENNTDYKEIMLEGAESLASRFNPKTGLIRSWDHGDWNYPVIIDNMMNLEFLFWASKESGDSKYRDISITHADNTLSNHFRSDFSSYHVVDYDDETGEVLAKKTYQGLSDDSDWARGQAWALYGFTVMYRETGEVKYLNQAHKIADFILSHPNMPVDLIPYWDFDDVASQDTFRDASAAAINASALLELYKYTDDLKIKDRYKSSAERMIVNLSSKEYLAELGQNGGFILKHSVGSLPHNSEVDVPLTYGDYYYIEALKRYKDWFL